MHLYIIRHAWAYEAGDPRWPDDSRRPLEPEGVERMASVVQQLVGRGFAPQAIATSPYVRCRQTADVIAAHVTPSPRVEVVDSLAPGSDFESLLAWSRQQQQHKCDSLAWVGHAPDVSFLTAALVGDSAAVRFAKGTVASIRLHGEIAAGSGELEWLATAKLLGA